MLRQTAALGNHATGNMALTHLIGFPRIGAQRELKFAVEAFWRGDSEVESVEETGRTLRHRHWALQRDAGIALLPAGDFSFYDGTGRDRASGGVAGAFWLRS